MIVHMANGEPAETGRQAILPVVIRDAQRALKLDPAHGIRMHLREAEHQLVVLQLYHLPLLLSWSSSRRARRLTNPRPEPPAPRAGSRVRGHP